MDETENERQRNVFQRMMDGMRGIGGMLQFALVGFLILGVAMMIPGVREWIAEKMPEDWKIGIETMLNKVGISLFPNVLEDMPAHSDNPEQTTARSLMTQHGVPTEIAATLTRDDATWRSFIQTAKEANGGRANADTLMNGRTIGALLLNQPALARDLLNAMPAPAAAPAARPGTNNQQSGHGTNGGAAQAPANANTNNQMVTRALGQLLNDTATINRVLANPESRLLVAQAIQKLSPGIRFKQDEASRQAISDFIANVGMQNGALTPEFKTFLTAAMSGNAAQIPAAATAYFTPLLTNPATKDAANALLGAVDPASITDPMLKRMVENPSAAAALAQVATNAGITPQTMGAIASNDQSTRVNALADIILSESVLNNPAQLRTLGAQFAGMQGGDDRTVQDMLQLVQYNATPVTRLLRTLGNERAREFIRLVSENDQPALQRFVLKEENFPAFRDFARTADTGHLPASMKEQVVRLGQMSDQSVAQARTAVENGFDEAGVKNIFLKADGAMRPSLDIVQRLWQPGNRTYLREQLAKLGTPQQINAALREQGMPYSYQHINAVLTCLSEVQQNPANQGENASRAHRVMGAFLAITQGDRGSFNHLTSEDLAGFMRNPANRRSMHDLLQRIPASAVPAEFREAFTLLKSHWGDRQSGGVENGIGELLSIQRGAEDTVDFLREKMRLPAVARRRDLLSDPAAFAQMNVAGVWDEAQLLMGLKNAQPRTQQRG